MRWVHALILLLALICFLLAAAGIPATVSLVACGLTLFTLNELLRSLP